MRIVFFPIDCCPFHGKTLEERPIGGTETAIIHLSEALDALGHEVFVVTPLKTFPPNKPIYLTHSMVNHLPDIDLLIIIRGLEGVLFPLKCKKRFFWTGDAWTNRHTFGIGDNRYAHRIDTLLSVSDWQARTLCESSGFPFEKTHILRNGVKLSLFEGEEVRRRKRLIYTSTPTRGLIYLPEIYLELKKKHPDLELHLFSSPFIYSRKWPPEKDFNAESEKWIEWMRKLPNCYPHGSVIQKQLAREFMKSAILVYPTDFEETSCISAMEAQAAGCAIVTTDLAALKETVGESGILIEGNPKSKNYLSKFIETCDSLLSDDPLFNGFSAIAKKRAETFDWKLRAQQLLEYVQHKHGMS